MADKHTKRELFQSLLIFAMAAEAEDWVINGLQHEIDLLDNRKKSSKGDAKKKAEQAALKVKIAEVLAANGEMKATPIGKAVDKSVQQVSALLRQMVADKQVVRREDKKETFFSLVESE